MSAVRSQCAGVARMRRVTRRPPGCRVRFRSRNRHDSNSQRLQWRELPWRSEGPRRIQAFTGAFHPKEDYEWIVKGGAYQVLTTEVKGERKPRVDVREPEKSLLLLKATGAVAHGGGQRFARESREYRSLLTWIRNGAPFGREPRERKSCPWHRGRPTYSRLSREAEPDNLQSLRISPTAEPKIVTAQALFVSNDDRIARRR